MATSASEPLILILDDDVPGPIEVIAAAPATAGQVRISATSDDTAGQSLDGWTLDVLVYGDDTEGQAMTLRFPNPAAAAEFQRRLLIAGTLAGTIALGSIGAAALSNQARVANTAIQPAVGYVHDAEKISTLGAAVVYAHDAEKLGAAAAVSAAERANAAGWADATSVERARAQAAASASSAVGAEAAAKAAQAAAIAGAGAPSAGAEAAAKAAQAAAIAGAAGAEAEGTEAPAPAPTSHFRGR